MIRQPRFDQTTSIVLEAAHFTRKSAAGCARRYGLHTESSHRFERGVDPMLPPLAMERATELALQICGGEAGPAVQQKDDAGLRAKPSVAIRLSRLVSLLGMPLTGDEVGDILNRIAEAVEATDDGWSVTPPSYRYDIECEADLVEEVARVKGYDNIPTAMPRIAPRSIAASEAKVGVRQLRHSLVARDYREAITYSFIAPDSQKLFSDEEPVRLSNPLAENMSVMRTSLLPGLLDALRFNSNRQHSRVRLFEVGATYHKAADGYQEVQRIAGLVTGSIVPAQWGIGGGKMADFYDLKGDLEAVLALTGQKKPIIFNEFEHISAHPGQVSKLSRNVEDGSDVELGWLGRLHPMLQKQYGFASDVFVFELDLDRALEAQLPEFKGVSRFPSIRRDLSVLIHKDVPASRVVEVVSEKLGKSLNKVVIFDVYRGQGIADDQKSISLSLILQHDDETMVDEQAEQLSEQALSVLKHEFAAVLRS